MIVLSKKRITIMFSCVFLSILVFVFVADIKETVPTVSLPISGKTIVVDAGHPRYLLTR